jgi:hypothetical protein
MAGSVIAAVITAVAASDSARYQSNTQRDMQKRALDQQNALAQQQQAQTGQTDQTGTNPNVAATSTPTMPTPDAQAVTQAKQQSIAAQVARRGRASTILTNPNPPSETLG